MGRYHPQEELAPRDILSRSIVSEIHRTEASYVLLDVTHLPSDLLQKGFPTIHQVCLKYGIDMTRQGIPVSPAAHFFIGGVETDLWGETSIPGLFAAGETACNGVHGANRLASNSLLEGLVFGARVGLAAGDYAQGSRSRSTSDPDGERFDGGRRMEAASFDEASLRRQLQMTMWKNAGIIRSSRSLEEAEGLISEGLSVAGDCSGTRGEWECRNLLTVSALVIQGALRREESVGAHYREDFPDQKVV